MLRESTECYTCDGQAEGYNAYCVFLSNVSKSTVMFCVFTLHLFPEITSHVGRACFQHKEHFREDVMMLLLLQYYQLMSNCKTQLLNQFGTCGSNIYCFARDVYTNCTAIMYWNYANSNTLEYPNCIGISAVQRNCYAIGER